MEKAYDFFPYGLPVKETVGQQRLWFGGYELEHQNTSDYTDDLYFLHARWYFPSMARFLSPDPLRGDPAQPQSLNLYAYVRGNPINFVDPWGLKDQGAMSPASTSDEWQRDGVCTDVMSDPDCWNEQITVTAKAPRIDLQQIADAHDAKVLQEWLEWQAYTNSAYALRTARYAGKIWSELAAGTYFGTRYGSEALDWYAATLTDPEASSLEYAGAAVGGFFAALWTPETWTYTAVTLASAWAAPPAVKKLFALDSPVFGYGRGLSTGNQWLRIGWGMGPPDSGRLSFRLSGRVVQRVTRFLGKERSHIDLRYGPRYSDFFRK